MKRDKLICAIAGALLGVGGLAMVSSASGQGLDSNVLVLLHCDGTAGGTTFVDESDDAHVVTPLGNAQTTTLFSKFGGASCSFDGSGSRLSIPDDPSFTLAGDFTVDFWARGFAPSFSANVFGWEDLAALTPPGIYYFSGWNMAIPDDLNNLAGPIELSPPSDWVHVAVVRQGGVATMFLDGQQVATANLPMPLDGDGLFIGGNPLGTFDWAGHLDEVRLSNVARWTANFTPPTQAYSAFTPPPPVADSCNHPQGGATIDPFGDHNGNGFVNVADAMCSVFGSQAVLGGQPLSSVPCLSAPEPAADLNCDGAVDVSDTLLVIRIAIGLPVPDTLSPDANGCPAACASCSGGGPSCLIAGACVAAGDRSATDDCLVCTPTNDAADWTAETAVEYFLDADDDTYGVTGDTTMSCVATDPYTATQGGDCDDDEPTTFPTATEVCDDVDNNCVGGIDETFTSKGLDCDGPDTDGCENGVFVCTADTLGVECGPESPADLPEICGNIADDNCNGETDENCAPETGSPLGNGSDGPLVTTGPTTLNTTASSASGSANSDTIAVGSASGFAAGQRVLVHQTQGANAGNYEHADVTEVNGVTLTLARDLVHSYSSSGADRAQVVVVPQYTDVTVAAGHTVSAPAWNGTTGGILVFVATGTVDIDGSVDMGGNGFRGGAGGSSPGWGGQGGENYEGFGSSGGSVGTCSVGPGGGTSDGVVNNSQCASSPRGTAAGGGGGDSTNNSDDGAAGGGGGGHGGGGGGGVGGDGCGGAVQAPGVGGTTGVSAGGGGGGHCPGSAGGNAGSAGGGPTGGVAGSGTLGGGGGGTSGANYGGGGGGGGGLHGDANFTVLSFGGGGGGGGGSAFGNTGGGGGDGGGAIVISAGAVELAGALTSSGVTGGNPGGSARAACGGSGAGGAIYVQAVTISGGGSMSAIGGSPCNPNAGTHAAGGGGGGVGRTRVEFGTGMVPSVNPAPTTDLFADPTEPGQSQGSSMLSCAHILRAAPASPSGQYWLDPTGGATDDAYLAHCDMSTAGGGWSMVMNLDTSDGHVLWWANDLWTNGQAYGSVETPFDGDHVSPAWSNLNGADEILVVVHDQGSVVGWKQFAKSNGDTMLTHMNGGDNTLIASSVIAADTSSINTIEHLVRSSTALYANRCKGPSGTPGSCTAGSVSSPDGDRLGSVESSPNADNTGGGLGNWHDMNFCCAGESYGSGKVCNGNAMRTVSEAQAGWCPSYGGANNFGHFGSDTFRASTCSMTNSGCNAHWSQPSGVDYDYAIYLRTAVFPADCSTYSDEGATESGNYVIDPDGSGPGAPFLAYCEMETAMGGWTRCLEQTLTNGNRQSTGMDVTDVRTDSPLPPLSWVSGQCNVASADYEVMFVGERAGTPAFVVTGDLPANWMADSSGSTCLDLTDIGNGDVARDMLVIRNLTGVSGASCTGGGSSSRSFWMNRPAPLPDTTHLEYSFHGADHFRRIGTTDNNDTAAKRIEVFLRPSAP